MKNPSTPFIPIIPSPITPFYELTDDLGVLPGFWAVWEDGGGGCANCDEGGRGWAVKMAKADYDWDGISRQNNPVLVAAGLKPCSFNVCILRDDK